MRTKKPKHKATVFILVMSRRRGLRCLLVECGVHAATYVLLSCDCIHKHVAHGTIVFRMCSEIY